MSGDGPVCPYCLNPEAARRDDPHGFAVHERIIARFHSLPIRCTECERLGYSCGPCFRQQVGRLPTTTANLTGSDPDFTGDKSTDEYIRQIRGSVEVLGGGERYQPTDEEALRPAFDVFPNYLGD